MPRTDRASAMYSRTPGLLSVKQLMRVDTAITPPVTSGYCAEAGTCDSDISSIRLANQLSTPLTPMLKTVAPSGFFFSPFIKQSAVNEISAETGAHTNRNPSSSALR